jgi:hypothetical protein
VFRNTSKSYQTTVQMSRHTLFFLPAGTSLITSFVDHVVQLYPSRITSGISTIMCNLLWSKEGPVNLPLQAKYWGYYLDKYKVFACLWSLMQKEILIPLYNCRYDANFHLIFSLILYFKKLGYGGIKGFKVCD